MKSKLQRELYLGWKARVAAISNELDMEREFGGCTKEKAIEKRLHQARALKNPYAADRITKYELAEKKMQFFKTVLESIACIYDVASSNDLGELARLALEEEFCDMCGAHPGAMVCSACGRIICNTCYQNNILCPCGE